MKYYLILIAVFIVQNVQANIVINEVLSNEPGTTRSLEWIELYNNSDSSLLLSDYTLVINSDTIFLPARFIEAESYIIICKKLYSTSGEASFESYWGNGSNVWGDTEYESQKSEPIEALFSLLNSSDTIYLEQEQNIVSSFGWDESGEDGVSWERKFADSTLILQSKSNIHATPGYINSITLVQKDLAVESVSVILENLTPLYTFTISNRGLTDIDNGMLYIYDSANTALLQVLELPMVLSDSMTFVETSFECNSNHMYTSCNALLITPQDVRSSNDSLIFTAVSYEYPPILISEFLANPQGDKQTEWIEIHNRSNEQIDLQNWLIGDALRVNQICRQQIFIEPNQYVVLAKSQADFLNEYLQFDGIVLELDSWASLNNDGDIIRLQDNYHILAGKYNYNLLYDENYTVCRDLQSDSYQWGRSSEPNGTPGYENILFQIDNSIKINLSSKYISPDGDGYEDNVVIGLDVPLSDKYTLKLYDVSGNIVKLFYDNKQYIPNQTVWDGLDDKNERLPIGIYVLYLSTEEGESTKETIVIAR